MPFRGARTPSTLAGLGITGPVPELWGALSVNDDLERQHDIFQPPAAHVSLHLDAEKGSGTFGISTEADAADLKPGLAQRATHSQATEGRQTGHLTPSMCLQHRQGPRGTGQRDRPLFAT